MFADSLGFLYTQKELMTRADKISMASDVALDLVHVTAAPPTKTTCREIMQEIEWISSVLSRDGIHIAYDAAVIRRISHSTIAILGLQHPPVDAEMANDIIRLASIGIRVSTIAYEMANVYGGGFATPDEPLTEKGRRLLKWLRAADIILDLSHAGARTASDALGILENEIMRAPAQVMASHAGCAAVYDHPRNLSDDTIRRIAAQGGIIGIPTATFMLSADDDSLEPFIRHMAHALKLAGEDAVTIGSDGIYKRLNLEEQKKIFEMMKEKIDPRGNFRARFPDQPEELNTPYRMEVLYHVLAQEFGNRIAAKVCGDNLVAYFRRTLSF